MSHNTVPNRNNTHLVVQGTIGILLVILGGSALLNGETLTKNSVTATLWTAFYLTMVVAYADFKLPVFGSTPQAQTFLMILFCGHISLLFDSFAVVLLLQTGVTMVAVNTVRKAFHKFAFKTAGTYAALTVGGAFYLGELWGLPYYITSGLAQPLVGLPLLLILTPLNILLAGIIGKYFPITLSSQPFDRTQARATAEFSVALGLIIVTHSPQLCVGIALLYTTVRGTTTILIHKLTHEFRSGAENALGLIIAAVIITELGWTDKLTSLLSGWTLLPAAALSSPLAGALAPAATSLHEFYVSLSWLMLGAPLCVFSSLVGMIVFNGRIPLHETPLFVQKVVRALPWHRTRDDEETVAEALLYTAFVIPMNAVLGVGLWLGNTSELFLFGAKLLGVSRPM